MSTGIIILLILAGLFLLVIELLIVPGVTIAGIASIVFLAAGIIFSYKYFGNTGGNVTLFITLLFIIITVIFALKPRTWKRVSLQTSLEGNLKDGYIQNLKEGDRAIAKSKMSPIGEIIIQDNVLEAESIGPYIDAGQEVEIVKIENSKIFVKPLNLI
jgi:membrane-bound ClpP family serine protease